MPYLIGDIVEPFVLPRAEGGDYYLAPSTHEATVVIWTANHCPYALAWHDRLQDVIKEYRPRGVDAVQINANNAETHPEDSRDAMRSRVELGEFESSYVHDENQQLSKHWGAKVTPDVFVLDGDGRVVYRGAPDADHDDPSQNADYLRSALEDVLNGRAVAVPETRVRGCSVKWIINDQPNPYI